MHRITSFELLRTLIAVLVQKSKWRDCKPHMLKSFFLSERKCCLCNFKSKAWVHERCFFLMKWNVICNAEDRFNVLELVCRASYVRASMHRITSFELLRTLIAVLVQKAMKRMQAHICWKASFSVRESWFIAILRVKLEYMKDVSFSWNEMLLQCRRQILMC